MTNYYPTELAQFGLKKEVARMTAEAAPDKWYPIRGRLELNPTQEKLEDAGLRGNFHRFKPILGRKNLDGGTIPLFLDPRHLGEFLLSNAGAVASAEKATIEIGVTNNKIDFNIGGDELTATIASATYPIGTAGTQAGTLCKAILDAIAAAEAAGTYTVTYDRATRKFTITRSEGALNILWQTGTNTLTNVGPTIGFSRAADSTGSLSYESGTTTQYLFDHAFTVAEVAKPSYTLFSYHGSDIVKKYAGGTCKRLEFTCNSEGLVEVAATVIAKDEADGAIGTPAFPQQQYFTFENVDFKIGGVSQPRVSAWNLGPDNGAVGLKTLSKEKTVYDIVCPARFMVEGGLTIILASEAERAKLFSNEDVDISIEMTNANGMGLKLEIPGANYKEFPWGEEQGFLAGQVTFEGFYAPSVERQFRAILTNDAVAY